MMLLERLLHQIKLLTMTTWTGDLGSFELWFWIHIISCINLGTVRLAHGMCNPQPPIDSLAPCMLFEFSHAHSCGWSSWEDRAWIWSKNCYIKSTTFVLRVDNRINDEWWLRIDGIYSSCMWEGRTWPFLYMKTIYLAGLVSKHSPWEGITYE